MKRKNMPLGHAGYGLLVIVLALLSAMDVSLAQTQNSIDVISSIVSTDEMIRSCTRSNQ